ncbi:MAG: SRPBCC domain-containing protein [Acidimicrobiia bacterium]|nr:SRPBCC domain-containing protein [Acidimicrobiia bacterium]
MIEESINVHAPPDVVFKAYVEAIDNWWPRVGTYRYSFAPPHTEPSSIQFEPELGGRFFERYADGTEYDIGRIERFDPPRSLAYTWRAPEWEVATLVEVTFKDIDGDTQVTVVHRNLPDDLAEGYAVGLREILVAFAERMRRNGT